MTRIKKTKCKALLAFLETVSFSSDNHCFTITVANWWIFLEKPVMLTLASILGHLLLLMLWFCCFEFTCCLLVCLPGSEPEWNRFVLYTELKNNKILLSFLVFQRSISWNVSNACEETVTGLTRLPPGVISGYPSVTLLLVGNGHLAKILDQTTKPNWRVWLRLPLA